VGEVEGRFESVTPGVGGVVGEEVGTDDGCLLGNAVIGVIAKVGRVVGEVVGADDGYLLEIVVVGI